jgi:lipopolysaccharide transport system permease protein
LLLAALSPAIFQALIAFGLFAGLAAYYGPVLNAFHIEPGLHSLLFIPVVLLTLMLAIGVACFTSILNAYGRDTWLTLRYVLSAWMLATPVFYPVDVIAEPYRWIIYLNPLTSLVEAARWSLLGIGTVRWGFLGLSGVLALGLLFGGLLFFSRQQGRLFDQP